MSKCSFVLYNNWESTFKMLSKEQGGKLILMIFAYTRTLEYQPTDDPMVNMAFEPIRGILDKDRLRYEETLRKRKEGGKKGGRPPKGT